MLATTGLVAFVLERISPIALVIIAIGLGIAKLGQRQTGIYKIACHSVVILWAGALVLHLVPGFDNLLVLDKALTGSGSIPFTLYLNLDKPLIVFALLLLMPDMLKRTSPISSAKTSLTQLPLTQKFILAALFIALPLVAWGVGIVEPEFSLPTWLWVFVINNLVFTCVAEEALFRGYIQNGLTKRFNPFVGIFLASFLFGIAHFAGGGIFIAIAALAGLLYGLTYYWTGRLIFAVLIHFGFNLVHLLFFTYPMAN
ncbi:type II CAAX endopeptidase family protein [Photobacterium rosenbergii]|uniref:Type II CAAX endopeptidase family protein n=1 Tax=Photobacterium rosenbergii TaxID=294936 RepID=A0ABU3ZC54_9GAMM|nr:type II CAAX endopeptidase family protein [Photobacterium rosenbergii]MDV5167687.1 type II CAAX endopeptidase family protein [Photobacterium rosenbergii]